MELKDKHITLRVSKELHDSLRIAAIKQGLSLQRLLTKILEKGLKNESLVRAK